MNRISLQLKNVISLLLATAASISWGVFARRFFDSPPKPAFLFGVLGAILLIAQTFLIFVESKEEEELSLIRRQRMDRLKQRMNENQSLSQRIQTEITAGDPDTAKAWSDYRSQHLDD